MRVCLPRPQDPSVDPEAYEDLVKKAVENAHDAIGDVSQLLNGEESYLMALTVIAYLIETLTHTMIAVPRDEALEITFANLKGLLGKMKRE